ncbi:hypothetical protein AB4Y45_44760 [Paraburkholderia sp. EG287A]
MEPGGTIVGLSGQTLREFFEQAAERAHLDALEHGQATAAIS